MMAAIEMKYYVTPQVVDTQNTIPSKFTLMERKETAPANHLDIQKHTFVISIPPGPIQ